MQEKEIELVGQALSVLNRALSAGARPSAFFRGAGDGDELFLTVRGANPDEDRGFALRVEGSALRVEGHCDPHEDERSAEGFTVRLDDLKRIVDEPEHYLEQPELVGRLVTGGPHA